MTQMTTERAKILSQAILDQCPLVAMPTFACAKGDGLDSLSSGQHRLVLGKNALAIEMRTDWVHARLILDALNTESPIPYGEVQPFIKWLCKPMPRSLMDQVLERFKSHCPAEDACFAIYNASTREWRIAFCDGLDRSASHIRYEAPKLLDHECVVFDIHSHGKSNAFFSQTDNKDDHGSTKIGVVVGELDAEKPFVCSRLTLLGVQCELDDLSCLPIEKSWVDLVSNEELSWGGR